MTGKIVKLPLSSLVEDLEVYPRHSVDNSHVQALVFALESGATLPPIVADKASKRITDGWHRGRAWRRFQGEGAVVDVELVPYKNQTEMILDAVERNACHGRKLDAIDKTRSVVMLRNAGCTEGQIALALHIPENRVSKLEVKLASTSSNAPGIIPGTNKITLKRSVAHLAGESLTKTQAEAHLTLPGTSFLLIARQLCLGLSQNMVNLDDEKLVVQLRELKELLEEKLS
jgi:hypothetical protein